MGIKHSRLPVEYQEVAYLQSNGKTSEQVINPYIDVNLYATNLTTVETKIYDISSLNVSQERIFGGDTKYLIYSKKKTEENPDNIIVFYNNSYRSLSGYPFDKDVTIKYDKNNFYINNELKTTFDEATFASTHKLYLFLMSDQADSQPFRGKMYYCKIWENDELIRDLIPCYRKADNVAGMYDLANNNFIAGQGGNGFTVGYDVDNNAPIQINDNSNFLAQYPSGIWNDTGYANAIITYDFNGKFTVNTSKELTETGKTRSKILATFNVIAGHKYLLRGNPTKPSSAATAGSYSNLQVDQNQGYAEGTYILTSTATIGEFTNSGEARLLMFYYTNQTYENAEYLPQMIDLTATFGAGNEPTTVEEFNEIYPKNYYPYNAG